MQRSDNDFMSQSVFTDVYRLLVEAADVHPRLRAFRPVHSKVEML